MDPMMKSPLLCTRNKNRKTLDDALACGQSLGVVLVYTH